MVNMLKQSLNFTKMIVGSEDVSCVSCVSLKRETNKTNKTNMPSPLKSYPFVINIITFTLETNIETNI